MKTQEDVKTIIKETPELMEILTIIQGLKLEQACLCAGMLRNTIWNHLTGKERACVSTDVDVIYFDQQAPYHEGIRIQNKLLCSYPQYQWEVRNQVYMHYKNPHTLPYSSVFDALSKFPEQCTAIGAKLNGQQEVELIVPYGVTDILDFTVKPTPFVMEDNERIKIYESRIAKKEWGKLWPQLKIIHAV